MCCGAHSVGAALARHWRSLGTRSVRPVRVVYVSGTLLVRFWYVFGTLVVRPWHATGAPLSCDRYVLCTFLVRFWYIFGTAAVQPWYTIGTAPHRVWPVRVVYVFGTFLVRFWYSKRCGLGTLLAQPCHAIGTFCVRFLYVFGAFFVPENLRLIQFQINHNFCVFRVHARPFAGVRFLYSRGAALVHHRYGQFVLCTFLVRFWYVFGTVSVQPWHATLAQPCHAIGTFCVRFWYV